MKKIVSFKTLLVAGFLLVCATIVKAGDVNLRIPITSVNKLFETVVHSKWFNYGAVGSGAISYYSVKMNTVTLQVQPNNKFTFSFGLSAYANFDLGLFSFDETSNGVLSGSGTLNLYKVGDGYKIMFDIKTISYSASDWYAGLLSFSLQLFKSKIPEISTSSEQPLLPTTVTSLFTSATPTLTTTSTEIVLSYDLVAGPRYITAFNEVNGDQSIGNIENTTGGEENMYASPHTFEWYAGSQKSIRTPVEILEPQSQAYYKYQNWLNNDREPQNEISPREIEINVGNSDQSYKAFFKDAVHIQASNLLEWTQTGGQISFNGQVSATQDKYEFTNASASIQLGSTPPANGIEWVFQGWTDGNMNQTRPVSLNGNKQLTAFYKAKNHSNSSAVAGLDHRRKVVSNPAGTVAYRVYESNTRLWLQRKASSANEWENEKKIPELTPSTHPNRYYYAYKNPAIAYSNGLYERPYIWIVCEAWTAVQVGVNFVDQVDLLAIRIDDFDTEEPTYTASVVASKQNEGAFEGYAIGSNVEGNLVVAYLPTFTTYSSTAAMAMVSIVNTTGENFVTYPYNTLNIWTKIGPRSNIDVAVNGNMIGIVVQAGGVVLYAEGINAHGVLYWDNYQTQMFGSGSGFSEVGRIGASITNWQNAFRIAYGATTTINGVTQYGVVNFNIGSQKSSSGTSFYFDSTIPQADVEIGLLGPTDYSNGHLAFTVVANQSGSKSLKQYTYMYGGAYSVLVQTIPMQTPSRTMASTSYGSKVLGFYKSDNQGLYKVNELQPSTNPKQVSISTTAQVPLVAVWEPSEKENEVMPSYIGSIQVGKNSIQSQAVSDSISSMAVSDWFDWNGESLSLNYYAPKGNPIHYKVGVSDTNGVLIQSWRPKAHAMQDLIVNSIQNTKEVFTKLELTSKKIVSEPMRVRLVIIPDSPGAILNIVNILHESDEPEVDELSDLVIDSVEGDREYQLIQAYPNPFNPSTTIRYNLKQDANVLIQVYDIAGKLVRTLVNANKSTGFHDVSFDAGHLASGVYLVRIQVHETGRKAFMETKRITLIK